MISRHKLLILATAGALAAAGGGAYAATQTSGHPRQTFLDDVAARLHVTPAQLQGALRGALIDRLTAAVKAGRLTQAQATAIERRIERRQAPLMFAPRLLFGGPRPLPLRRWRVTGAGGPLQAAAVYLGLTRAQLLGDLRSGQSLAQIARVRGKSVSGLEQAMVAALRSRLDRAVAAGLITRAQEQRILGRWSSRLREAIEYRARVLGPVYRGGAGWVAPTV